MPAFSARIAQLHASPIREILSVIERPGMISFAGGLPAAETFPALDLAGLPPSLLQYGPSEGEPGLREAIAHELQALDLPCSSAQVLVLSGSQQGIDLAAKLFVDPRTPVAVESPTYLAALQVFRFFGAAFIPLDPAAPEDLLRARNKPVLTYVIPTFQNPTGRCYTSEERARVAAAVDASGCVLFEDDPYRDLVYEPCARQPVCSMLRRSEWIYQGSFSKTFAPGLRLGFLACSPSLAPFLVRLKQAADLHSSRVSQYSVLRQLQDPARQDRLGSLRTAYRSRRDAFAEALSASLADQAEWEVPKGGLFFWLRLRQPLDTGALLRDALERGVAFMPGESFFPGAPGTDSFLRLNFSHASQREARRGLRILGTLLAEKNAAAGG